MIEFMKTIPVLCSFISLSTSWRHLSAKNIFGALQKKTCVQTCMTLNEIVLFKKWKMLHKGVINKHTCIWASLINDWFASGSLKKKFRFFFNIYKQFHALSLTNQHCKKCFFTFDNNLNFQTMLFILNKWNKLTNSETV